LPLSSVGEAEELFMLSSEPTALLVFGWDSLDFSRASA
jgi:hypothetical protein